MIDLRSTFHFHTPPFTREIRPEDVAPLPHLREATDGIRRAIEARMSAAIMGPAGSGKTVVLRVLRHQLPEARYRIYYLKIASGSKRDLCSQLADVCGVPRAGRLHIVLDRLQERFLALVQSDGLRPTLLLDEAHELWPDTLSMLRILTNFEMDSRLVLSVVLAGQAPLKHMLARDEHDDIARRIFHYVTLRALSRDETLA
jgi:type II secretory pathway predicted ATPase ExeA